jgi:3-hydroxyisobutyrate dehydrogenase-like beta-hydroxyacid dehydrogenase
MSTIAPTTARTMAQAHGERGAAYVAAPVFGRPDAAASGQLWIATSGPTAAKAVARPVLETLAQGVHDFGEDPAAAHIVKLAGNFLIAAASEAMAEAYTFGEKGGLDRVQLAEFFGSTLFPSRIYQNYGKAITEHRYEPASRTCAWCSGRPMHARCRCRSRVFCTTVSWRWRRRATARWTGPRSV